ncbi:fumarase, class II [Pseudomonas agarici]|nr:fumarase, class II [Pseudomonas agarici]
MSSALHEQPRQDSLSLPTIAQNLLSSIELLAKVSRLLADQTIASFKVNIKQALSRHPILLTALNPIIEVALEHTDLPRSQLETLPPERLTVGGV